MTSFLLLVEILMCDCGDRLTFWIVLWLFVVKYGGALRQRFTPIFRRLLCSLKMKCGIRRGEYMNTTDAISISYVCEGIMPKRLERKSRILLIVWIAPGKDAVMARKVVFQIYICESSILGRFCYSIHVYMTIMTWFQYMINKQLGSVGGGGVEIYLISVRGIPIDSLSVRGSESTRWWLVRVDTYLSWVSGRNWLGGSWTYKIN